MTFDISQLCDVDIDVIDGDRGKNYPHQDELHDSGHCLFLSAKNVTQNGFVFSDNQYITREKDELLNNGKLIRGDIVITTRGTVENVAIYSDDVPYDNIRINSGMLIIRCGNDIDNYYLYQVLRSKWFYNQIISIQSGSAQPQLPKSHFLKMSIPTPDMETQRKIAVVLSRIGNKITVNTAINENLHLQAA
ncbi:MAG: restriction endonuclease subunit S [Oscillospiraceae bacterium]